MSTEGSPRSGNEKVIFEDRHWLSPDGEKQYREVRAYEAVNGRKGRIVGEMIFVNGEAEELQQCEVMSWKEFCKNYKST